MESDRVFICQLPDIKTLGLDPSTDSCSRSRDNNVKSHVKLYQLSYPLGQYRPVITETIAIRTDKTGNTTPGSTSKLLPTSNCLIVVAVNVRVS